jgi:hypothetical protein
MFHRGRRRRALTPGTLSFTLTVGPLVPDGELITISSDGEGDCEAMPAMLADFIDVATRTLREQVAA